jgi:hypothetical protein
LSMLSRFHSACFGKIEAINHDMQMSMCRCPEKNPDN